MPDFRLKRVEEVKMKTKKQEVEEYFVLIAVLIVLCLITWVQIIKNGLGILISTMLLSWQVFLGMPYSLNDRILYRGAMRQMKNQKR